MYPRRRSHRTYAEDELNYTKPYSFRRNKAYHSDDYYTNHLNSDDIDDGNGIEIIRTKRHSLELQGSNRKKFVIFFTHF